VAAAGVLQHLNKIYPDLVGFFPQIFD